MKNNGVRRLAGLVGCLALLSLCLPMAADVQAQAGAGAVGVWLRNPASPASPASLDGAVGVWLSDPERDIMLAQQPDLAFARGGAADDSSIAVDESRRYQSMVGFGASFTDSSAWLVGTQLSPTVRAALMRELFSRDGGIALGMLRQPMGASDFSVTGNYSYDDVPPGQSDPDLSEFSVAHDDAYIVPVLKQALALNPELRIAASPWSPPGWMKSTDSMIGGSLEPAAYDAFAHYFVRFIKEYAERGVPISYLTPQNEALYQPAGYPGMLMTPEQQQLWIREHLGPALAEAGLDTGVLVYDHNWDAPGYPETVYSDARAAAYVAGTAWHCYGGVVTAQTVVHNAYPNQEAHHTECSGGQWQGTAREAFDGVIGLVINAPRQWAKSVVLWNMALDENNGPTNNGCFTCRGVVTVNADDSYTKNLDYYALGHASKFVRPGALRIGSSTQNDGIQSVAFRNPDGSKVLLAHNTADTARTFRVVWGDRSFSYTLNASAAATFSWSGRQRGATKGFEQLDRTVDLPFRNPDGSRVMLTYHPDQAPYQHTLRVGERVFSYTLPAGAVFGREGKETRLKRNNWTANASSAAPDDPPARAIDGDATTRWSGGHGQTNGDWFQVDLGAVRNLDGLLIDAAGNTGDFARAYQVYVSNDGRNWGSAIASGPGGGQLLRIVVPPLRARYVRVVITVNSGNWWSIAEFDAFSTNNARDPQQDAVQSRQFTTISGARGLAVYNERDTAARLRAPLSTREAYYYTLPARAAAIFSVAGPGAGQPPAPRISSIAPAGGIPGTQIELRGSDFGAFQGASSVMIGNLMASIIEWSDSTIIANAPDGLAAGALPVTVLVNGRASNAQQFEVRSPDDALPRDGWSAEASSSQPGDVPANALDGDSASRWSTGAAQAPGQWLEIDMGAPRTFSQVVLDAGASSGDYPRGYKIYVSSDGTSWGQAIAEGSGSGRVVAASFAATTARYLRIEQTQSAGNWWAIHELYVFE